MQSKRHQPSHIVAEQKMKKVPQHQFIALSYPTSETSESGNLKEVQQSKSSYFVTKVYAIAMCPSVVSAISHELYQKG